MDWHGAELVAELHLENVGRKLLPLKQLPLPRLLPLVPYLLFLLLHLEVVVDLTWLIVVMAVVARNMVIVETKSSGVELVVKVLLENVAVNLCLPLLLNLRQVLLVKHNHGIAQPTAILTLLNTSVYVTLVIRGMEALV